MMGRMRRVKPDPVLMRQPQGVAASCHRLATPRRRMLRALWKRDSCHADALLVGANHASEPVRGSRRRTSVT
jgi:hypothetical protein